MAHAKIIEAIAEQATQEARDYLAGVDSDFTDELLKVYEDEGEQEAVDFLNEWAAPRVLRTDRADGTEQWFTLALACEKVSQQYDEPEAEIEKRLREGEVMRTAASFYEIEK